MKRSGSENRILAIAVTATVPANLGHGNDDGSQDYYPPNRRPVSKILPYYLLSSTDTGVTDHSGFFGIFVLLRIFISHVWIGIVLIVRLFDGIFDQFGNLVLSRTSFDPFFH